MISIEFPARDVLNFKVISTIKYMKILGNSSRGPILIQKRYLYKYCILLIALYSFQLWYYNKALLVYPLKELRKMQWRAALWVLGIFYTSLMLGIEAIVSFIPIYLYLQKLCGRFHLRAYSLLLNYIIRLIRPSDNVKLHTLLLERLISRQWVIIKSFIIDMDNRFNKVFSSFSSFNYEFSPRNSLIDIFPNYFLQLFFFSYSE